MITYERLEKYDSGELTWPEIVKLFQELINTGFAWTLQAGRFSNMAKDMIDKGYCKPKKRKMKMRRKNNDED